MSSDIFSSIGSLIRTALGGPLGNVLGDVVGQPFNPARVGMFQSLGLPQSGKDSAAGGKGGFNFNSSLGK